MTRKDYIAASDLLRTMKLGKIPRKEIAEFLSTIFKADNDRFDKARFMDACSPSDVHTRRTIPAPKNYPEIE
jgi:hypothetical protein